MPKMKDITGQRFGYLVVLEPVLPLGRHGQWRCICDCGRVITRLIVNLKRKHIKRQTCGCVNGQFRHGYAGKITRHPLYRVWSSMHNRCRSPRDPSYPDYGGRGIKVCERWTDFTNFITDIGERPLGRTLDRIDNDGNYEPSNVRWATAREQIKNRRVFQALGKFSTEELKAELQKRGAL